MRLSIVFLLSFCWYVKSNNLLANPNMEREDRKLKVGLINNALPISGSINKKYSGVAVDLWKLLATELELKYTFYPLYDQYFGLELTRKGLLDVLIGPYDIDSSNYELLEYSTPFLINSVSLFVKKVDVTFLSVLHELITPLLLNTLALALVSFFIFCVFIWLVEKEKHPLFKKNRFISGMGNSSWVLVSSFLRDLVYEPATSVGRIIISFWLVLSVVFMTIIVSSVTSSILKISSTSYSTYQTHFDIKNKKIGVLENTDSVEIAKSYGASVFQEHKLESLFNLLDQGIIQGVMADKTTTQFFISSKTIDDVYETGLVYRKDFFSFVFPDNSLHKNIINYSLLIHQERGKVLEICRKYFYKDIDNCNI